MVSKKQKVDYHYCDGVNLELANTKKLQHVQLLLLSLLIVVVVLLCPVVVTVVARWNSLLLFACCRG